MKIGVVGNRKGWNRLTIYKKLDSLGLTNDDTIVTGGAKGVDTYAMDYAKEKGIGLIVFYPSKLLPIPERYYHRNSLIAYYSDRVIAFNKKIKSGTTNTINQCYSYNTPVEIITPDLTLGMICPICSSIMVLNKNRWYVCINKKCKQS